ncbi:MAG: cell wall hydrolase [Alphaproteobacteria bacterium]|nr:cell wall hydrolase [Alphaproteobacteria bacterium]MDD9920114.1 cell wall hydrolase [Alphaproteobacteria bacterium]
MRNFFRKKNPSAEAPKQVLARKWSRWLYILFTIFIVLGCWLVYVSSLSYVGTAGWMRDGIPQFQLNCGGRKSAYRSYEVGVFVNHPQMPCGSLVKVTKIGTFKSVVARVVHTDVRPSQTHVVDLTLAAALELGVKPRQKGLLKVAVTLLPNEHHWHWPIRFTPVVGFVKKRAIEVNKKELHAFTQVLVGEVGHLFDRPSQLEGAYAVGYTVLNRYYVRFNKKNSIRGVVFDGSRKANGRRKTKGGCQFSPFCTGTRDPHAGHRNWKRAKKMAHQFLTGTVPGKYRWMQHAMRDVTYFYAPLPMRTYPRWQKSVKRLHQLPAGWDHWFLIPRSKKALKDLKVARQFRRTWVKPQPQTKLLAKATVSKVPLPTKRSKFKKRKRGKKKIATRKCVNIKCLLARK